MSETPVSHTRNIVLLGHSGAGKTTLVDAILHKTGINDRLGLTSEGNSAADWTEEEKDRKITIWAKPFRVNYTTKDGEKLKLTILDTPGYIDFQGQTVAAASVADAALIVVDAAAGIQIGSVKAWKLCEKLNLPCGIVITGLDKDNVDFESVLSSLQATWDRKCVPVELPTHDRHAIVDILAQKKIPDELAEEAEQAMGELEEDAAEEDDNLLEKYLGGEHLTPEELKQGLRLALQHRHFFPVFETEVLEGVGVSELLDEVYRLFPSPADCPVKDENGEEVPAAADAPFTGFVWRSVNDPFTGQLNFIRVYGGTLNADSEFLNVSTGQKEKSGTMHVYNGRKDETVSAATAGDIVALAKLKHTSVNDTVGAPGSTRKLPPIDFPHPVVAVAVTPKTSGDDDKIGVGLQRIAEEDPTIRVERNSETHELILSGMGDTHIDIALSRMKKRSNVDVDTSTPKIAYKETITGHGEGHYKHKKQSGGRGQYGEVYLKVDPLNDGEEEWFVNSIVGGAIPRNFIPAVEKGLVEGMERGVLAGYPVIKTRVTVYDGSYHDVDSSEVAFKIAASRALGEGTRAATPVLLEPIMNVRIMVPDQFMGDITGDLNHKRGRILGMDTEDGMQVINAEIPQAEIFRYSSELRSMTQGQGTFEATFSRYDIVPANIAQKVIAESDRIRHADED